jgi:hypothetical protein
MPRAWLMRSRPPTHFVASSRLLSDAHASISVPSTVKCSSLVSLSSRASATTVRKNSPATSCSSKRARLRLKVEWSRRVSKGARPYILWCSSSRCSFSR